MLRKILRLFMYCGLALLLMFVTSIGWMMYRSRPMAFDPQLWATGDEVLRWRMATDEHFSSMLLGKTKSEVIDLLGLSDSHQLPNWDDNWSVWIYLVSAGWSINGRTLRIEWEDGRVVKVYTAE